MNNRVTNIFVGFTPYHAYFADMLMADINNEVYCIFTKGYPKSPKVRDLGFLKNRCRLKLFFYVLSLIKVSILCRFFFLRGDEVNIYIPHPANILSNYLFFSDKVSSVNIYEDGIANYYDVDSSRGRVSVIYKVLCFLAGLPYREYSGHLMGYGTGRVKSVCLSRPESAVCMTKVKFRAKVDFRYSEIDVVKGRILFLDQDVSSNVTSDQRCCLVQDLLSRFPVNKFEYYYKGHHDYSHLVGGMIPVDAEVISMPAEQIVDILKPQFVVSFYSSALINLTGRGIKCISLAASFVNISRDGIDCKLSVLFEDLGIECYKMPAPSQVNI